jgi:hypothetical protein
VSLYTKTFLWVNVHTDFFMGQYTDTLFYLLHCILHYYCIDLYYELCFIFYRHRLIICGLGHKFVVQILSQVTDKLFHIMLYQVHLTKAGFQLTTLVVIGPDFIGSCKSNYHTISNHDATVLCIIANIRHFFLGHAELLVA